MQNENGYKDDDNGKERDNKHKEDKLSKEGEIGNLSRKISKEDGSKSKTLRVFAFSISVAILGIFMMPQLKSMTNYKERAITSNAQVKENVLNSLEKNEIYKISGLVDTEDGVLIEYLYDEEEMEAKMKRMSIPEGIEVLENWEYSDDLDLNTPIDTITGKSNCQGVTLFILEFLDVKRYGIDIEIVELDKDSEIGHIYLEALDSKGKLYKLDFARDFEGSMKNLKDILED